MDELEELWINGELVKIPEGTMYIDNHRRGKDPIEVDNETWRRLIKRERFKTISKVLKERPEVISRDTFILLADFLLTLPEKGKPGPKPNKIKQEEMVSKYEDNKRKLVWLEPQESKRIKATARQAKKRLKDKEEQRRASWEAIERKMDTLMTHEQPTSQGLTRYLPES